MRLVAGGRQAVRVADLNLTCTFADGEEMLTDTSTTFRVESRAWQDPAGNFQLTLSRPYC